MDASERITEQQLAERLAEIDNASAALYAEIENGVDGDRYAEIYREFQVLDQRVKAAYIAHFGSISNRPPKRATIK